MIYPEGTVTIKGRTFPVAFTTNAVFQLDMYLKKNGLPRVSQFLSRLEPQSDGANMIVPAELDYAEMHLLLWAMLEGGRRKTHWRAIPFTVDEVGEIVSIEELEQVFAQLTALIAESTPKKDPKGTEGVATKNARARSGTGKRSSRQPSVSE